ncbi:MAG: hypothetical protein QM817_26065 [Archangium sp.]
MSAPETTEPKSSNRPFFIAFLIGAVVLTALPLLQERFLKAPPPILQLTPWTSSAGEVSSIALTGKVVLVQVEVSPCDAECGKRVTDFGAITNHVSDLGDKIVLVTLADTGAMATLEAQRKLASPAWRFAEPDPALLTQLQVGLVKFLGADSTEFTRSHSLVLLDQDGSVRGYWQTGDVGRGNAINAARLLAKKGPAP